MGRALFLAIGLYAFLVGAECMLIEAATLRSKRTQPGPLGLGQTTVKRTVVPPEWAPWSLMSAGAITMLYSFTLPKRVSGG